MSNPLKFNPVPAYQMLEVLYKPEIAQELYDSMTPEEQKTTCRIMELCRNRKEMMESSWNDVYRSIPRSLVIEEAYITVKVGDCLRHLGYHPQCISGVTSSEKNPVGIIDW